MLVWVWFFFFLGFFVCLFLYSDGGIEVYTSVFPGTALSLCIPSLSSIGCRPNL